MRLRCFSCSKSVSTEIPDETILRAAAYCPECIEAGKIVLSDDVVQREREAFRQGASWGDETTRHGDGPSLAADAIDDECDRRYPLPTVENS